MDVLVRGMKEGRGEGIGRGLVEGGGTYACYADPSWEELSRVFAAAGEVEDPGGCVGVYGVYGEEAHEGCLGGIMQKPRPSKWEGRYGEWREWERGTGVPARHEAVCEEEG